METEKPTAAPTIAFVHALRGLAALIVVWSHLSGNWLVLIAASTPMQDTWTRWIARPFHLFQNGGNLGVLVFFLISGYIITHTSLRETRRSFVIKRVFRIFPVLLVAIATTWLVVKLIAALRLPLLGLRDGGLSEWVRAALLLDGFTMPLAMLPPTWTLIVEVMFYALIFTVLNRQRTSPLASTWIMIGIWLITCSVFLNVPVLSAAVNSQGVYSMGFLILGRLIYFWQRGVIARVDVLVAFSVTLLAVAGFFQAGLPGYLFGPSGQAPGFEPVVGWALAILIFVGFMRAAPKRVAQPFAFLGDISYSLYLLHMPVGFLVLTVLDHYDVSNTMSFFIALAVTIVTSYVSFRLVEKPMQGLARRLLARHATGGETASRAESSPRMRDRTRSA